MKQTLFLEFYCPVSPSNHAGIQACIYFACCPSPKQVSSGHYILDTVLGARDVVVSNNRHGLYPEVSV